MELQAQTTGKFKFVYLSLVTWLNIIVTQLFIEMSKQSCSENKTLFCVLKNYVEIVSVYFILVELVF